MLEEEESVGGRVLHEHLAGLLVLLEIELRDGRIVEVVRRVLVLLALLEERVAEPVLDHLGLEFGARRNVGDVLVRRRLVDVEVLTQHLELLLGDARATSTARSAAAARHHGLAATWCVHIRLVHVVLLIVVVVIVLMHVRRRQRRRATTLLLLLLLLWMGSDSTVVVMRGRGGCRCRVGSARR